MKKVFGLAAIAVLAISSVASASADGNVELDGEKVVAPEGYIALCHIPAGEDFLVTGRGYGCENAGGMVKILPEQAAAGHLD